MNSEILHENLPMSRIDPVVIYTQIFNGYEGYAKGEALPARRVRDYELEYYLESEGSMYIDGELIPVRKGDIVFRKPGLHTQGIMPYSCYFISLDMANTLPVYSDWYNSCTWERKEVKFQAYYNNLLLDNIPTVFHIRNEDKYYSLFDMVYQAYINPIPGSELHMKSCILNILYFLYQDSCNPVNTMQLSPYGKVIRKTMDFINDNIDQKLSLNQLSDIAGLSPNYFHKVFTEIMKTTPNEYITTVRLNKAKDLLLRTNLQIYNIADQCGFNNVSYFSFLFKKSFQSTPIDFRNKHSYANYGMN
jgi:AraC-like DNA-binding protein